MPSVGWSGVEHATTGLWSEVTNHVSMLGESRFGGCQENVA